MENNKILVFIGAFLFGFSIVLILIAMFFTKQLSSNITSDYPETILGWLGASIIGGGIALKNYMDANNGMGYGKSGDDEGDSMVSFTFGISIALFALLATWLYITDVSIYALVICLVSSAFAFIGLIMVSYFSISTE